MKSDTALILANIWLAIALLAPGLVLTIGAFILAMAYCGLSMHLSEKERK